MIVIKQAHAQRESAFVIQLAVQQLDIPPF